MNGNAIVEPRPSLHLVNRRPPVVVAAREADAIEPTVLETGERLSQSLLFRLQRSFFEREGPRAWSRGIVPHYITSNPFIASAYSRVVVGFLRDCLGPARVDGAPAPLPLDPDEPVYIVELGAGSGRFAYQFLRSLSASLRGSALEDVRFTYVASDFTDDNVEALAAHPRLQPFATSGHLDFARFDAERSSGLTLRHAGRSISPGTLRNPLVVIANYFFDGIPQDVFRIEGRKMYECLTTVASSQPEPDLDDPAVLSRVDLSYTEHPARRAPYGDPDLDRVLARYTARLPDTHVLFPCAALRCIRTLRALSGGRLLLLSADRGYHGAASLRERPPPGITVHGSFSMAVDYEAIGESFLDQGGHAFYTSRTRSSLDIAAFLSGRLPGGAVETRKAFEEAIEQRGPDDFFAMKKATEKHYQAMTLEQILAWVRMAGWDANIFLGALPAVSAAIATADDEALDELYRTVKEVWDAYYPIGEDADLAFHLGCLLCDMGRLPEALERYRCSLDLYGPTAHTLYGMGVCHHGLDQLPEALRHLEEALLLDPGLEGAAAARRRVSAQMAARGRSAGEARG